jgi:hypothetical protein
VPLRQLARLVAGRTNRTPCLTGLIQFDNPIEPAIDHPDMLIGCNPEPIWIPDASPLCEKTTIGIEYLDPGVLPIADIDAIISVNHDGMRKHEFAGPVP